MLFYTMPPGYFEKFLRVGDRVKNAGVHKDDLDNIFKTAYHPTEITKKDPMPIGQHRWGARMSHPLDGCLAKIERANESIKNLETEIAAFSLGNRNSIVGNRNIEKLEYTFTAFYHDIPLRFSVLVGEIIHHLRSSLDHVIWALILQRHPCPSFKAQFPVCCTSEKYIAAVKNGIIKGISKTAQTIIESVQPCRNASPADDPLLILHDFDITDKHRLLAVVVSVAHIPKTLIVSGKKTENIVACIVPQHWSGQIVRPTQNGTEILKITFVRMKPNVEVKADFRFDIAFEEFGSGKIKPVVPSLSHLRDHVVKMIDLFTGEF